jgi:1,4-dihydroxy-2-naphthoate polyprenyltransferase
LLLTALAGGYLYTGGPRGYKYFALGDFMVFALMGPLMVIGTAVMLTGTYDADVFWVSMPIGLLVTAILHANNLRDIRHDREARIKTLANILGFKAAKIEYILLVVFAYFLTLWMIGKGLLPPWSLGVLLTFPLAADNIRCVVKTPAPSTQALAAIDLKTAQLHLAFGVLYLAGLLLGAFLR